MSLLARGTLAAACAVLAVLVVLLSWQNHRLKARSAMQTQAHEPARPALPTVGDAVAPFRVIGEDGFPVEIAFEGGDSWTVVLLFTMECPACRDTLPLWRDLVTEVVRSGARVVGVRLDERPDGPPTASLHAGLGFPVYLVGDEIPEFLRGALSVPATLVVDRRGTIATAIYGVPSTEQLGGILRTLSRGA